MNRHFSSALTGLLLIVPCAGEILDCGQIKQVKRSYGKRELRVDCELVPGKKWLAEYKGDDLDGASQSFDIRTGRRLDSSFYVNGIEEGRSFAWDSLGNIVGRYEFRNGKYVGKRENYFSPGKPAMIKFYDKKGKEEGPWKEWWPNGNKKAEFMAKKGKIVSGTEYYQDGSPRIRFVSKYEPGGNVLSIKKIEAEAWAPNKKPAGKIIKGNGEWILFPDGRDTTDVSAFREVYKDSALVKVQKLDSSEFASWMR